jgi:integrase
MGLYFRKGKGWTYDFILRGTRHTAAGFKTKTEARDAEAKRKEEIKRPEQAKEKIPTDTAFLDLVNSRLDYVKAYNSHDHYRTYQYMAKRWIKLWGDLDCPAITEAMIQDNILERNKISSFTANKELRYLRATFNYGLKKKLVSSNPTEGMEFLPMEKKVKYVPSIEDVDKVIEAADADTQDYLWTIRETLARVSEINRLTWDDVDIAHRTVVLYTRKKKGGHLTPRKVVMTEKLFEVLFRRYQKRDTQKPWVFWHRYWSRKDGRFNEGPFQDRKKIMKVLCKKAKVKYFRFHPLRHAGASIMDDSNVPLGAIQRILGHENRKTTEIYLHSISEVERKAMAIYEQARKKSQTNPQTEDNAEKKRVRRGHLTLIKY